MKRFFAIAVLCLWWSSSLSAAGFFCCAVSPALLYSGPGDVNAGAFLWVGLRAYSRATAGTKAANICNSGDANCADVNSLANGDFDVATAQAAPLSCGGAGGTCTIKTLYDKSGNTNCNSAACNFTQATIAKRPTLSFNCTAANKACMVFNGSSQVLATSGSVTIFAQPFSYATYAKTTAAATTAILVYETVTSNLQLAKLNVADTMYMYDGSANASFPATDNSFHTIQAVYHHPNSYAVVDGVTNTAAISSFLGNAGNPLQIGAADAAACCYWTGPINELGLWTIDPPAPILAAVNSNIDNYYRLGVNSAGFDPANPAASGYRLVFNDDFNSISTIDTAATNGPGFNWYVTKPFGFPTTTPGEISVANGVLTLTPLNTNASNWQLNSATPTGSQGHSFGGGFYFEASISFDASLVNTANGWPAVWSLALEHFTGNDQWPGQAANYTHFAELDFFEYINNGQANNFHSTIHDWYGIFNVTCASFCGVFNPNDVTGLGTTNWSNFHKISVRKVPGGSVFTYFDNVPTGVYNAWSTISVTPPPAGTNLFSILDTDHMVIILGTGFGGQSINVDYVRVWQ